MIKKILVTLFFSLASIAFAAEPTTQGNDQFSIDNPVVPQTIPGLKNGAGYLVIKNKTDQDRFLVSATSDAAKNTEVHEMKMADGRMVMRQMKELMIPANGEVVLKKGGYHLMLMGLHKPLKESDKVTFTLSFKNGDTLVFVADVVEGMMGHKH